MLLPDTASRVRLIEVVRIADPNGMYAAGSLVGEELARWEEENAQEVVSLASALPEGEMFRCFAPRYGIRAHGATGLLFEVAFCFHCHGARIMGPDVPSALRGIQTFDAGSPPGQELLSRFRACGS